MGVGEGGTRGTYVEKRENKNNLEVSAPCVRTQRGERRIGDGKVDNGARAGDDDKDRQEGEHGSNLHGWGGRKIWV